MSCHSESSDRLVRGRRPGKEMNRRKLIEKWLARLLPEGISARNGPARGVGSVRSQPANHAPPRQSPLFEFLAFWFLLFLEASTRKMPSPPSVYETTVQRHSTANHMAGVPSPQRLIWCSKLCLSRTRKLQHRLCLEGALNTNATPPQLTADL